MKTLDTSVLVQQADNCIMRAEEEISKAREDVVPHHVCSHTRLAIRNYLEAYLLEHDRSFGTDDSLNHLLDSCIEHDASFKRIRLYAMECAFNEDGQPFCYDTNQLNMCLDTAKSIQALFHSP